MNILRSVQKDYKLNRRMDLIKYMLNFRLGIRNGKCKCCHLDDSRKNNKSK